MEAREMAEQFTRAARELDAEIDVDSTLSRAVALAVELIDGCDEAGVSLVRARQIIDTHEATSDLVRRGDQLQYELGEGPLLDAAWDQHVVISDDLANDPRWPLWGPKVAGELGVKSMLSLQLFTGEDTLGALDLYSRRIFGFDQNDRVEGQALAAHVAVALAAAREIRGLKIAVDSRTIIGQAQGILMERFQLKAHMAFQVLRRVSQDNNRKLHEVAEKLVETRETPACDP